MPPHFYHTRHSLAYHPTRFALHPEAGFPTAMVRTAARAETPDGSPMDETIVRYGKRRHTEKGSTGCDFRVAS